MFFKHRKKHKYINGTRGIISIFLALLMAPFTMVAAALINVGRVQSAISVFDEALCNASNSTLGTYDSFLKKRFGLLAIRQGNNKTINEEDVQKFINGLFNDYMTVNCGSLPGAYSSGKIETDASGVYPLSDMSVLKTQVLEYSKYNVPAKFASDMLDIDKIIKSIEKIIPGYEMFDALTSGVNEVDNVVTMAESIDDLRKAVLTQNVRQINYNAAYDDFEEAVGNYNKKKEAYDDAEKAVEEAYQNLQNADPKTKAELQAAYDKAKEELEAAKKDLEKAESNVDEKKGVYSSTITSLRSQLDVVNQAKKDLADAIDETINGGLDFVMEADNAAAQEIIDDNNELIDDRKEKLKENEKNQKGLKEGDESLKGYKDEADALQNEIDGCTDINNKLENKQTLFKDAAKSTQSAKNDLKEHDRILGDAGYEDRMKKLDDLAERVNNFSAEEDAGSFSKGDYYVNVSILLLINEIDEFEEAMCAKAEGAGGLKMIKAIVNFWKALTNIGLEYDPLLVSHIDSSFYDSMGGLPSKREASYNPYAKLDKELSERYKDQMGRFTTNDEAYTGNLIDDIADVVDKVLDIIDSIENLPSFKRILKLAQELKKIYNNACDVINGIKNICQNFNFEKLFDSLMKKTLPDGYIYYKIPCRTTYQDFEKDSGLSDVVDVSSKEEMADALFGRYNTNSFCGAELEYILCGSMSEKENQRDVFWSIYLIRLIMDIIPVATNPDISAMIEVLMAIPIVGWILAILVVMFYLMVEPLLDTVILCGGGKVPLIKTCVYMTPSGLGYFAQAIVNLKGVSDNQEKQIKDLKNNDVYKNASSKSGSGNNKGGYMEIDYHTYLFVMATLLVNEEKTYKRLADIIQMEGSHYAEKSQEQFCLAYSYTYLRASGSFEGKIFIPISEDSVFSSQKRVIYQGY